MARLHQMDALSHAFFCPGCECGHMVRTAGEDELDFLNEEEGDDYLPDGEWECQFPGSCLHPSIDHHESECYTQEMAEDFLKARALGISIDDPPDPA